MKRLTISTLLSGVQLLLLINIKCYLLMAPMDMELLKLTITQIIWPVCNLT